MAAPTAINLYANNQPGVQNIPPAARNSFAACLHQIRQLRDDSLTQHWCQALRLLVDSTAQIDPNHRRYGRVPLQIRNKPLCYKNHGNRTFHYGEGGLSPAQQASETANSDTLRVWDDEYKSTVGWCGLVCSPTGGATFPSSGRWAAFEHAAQNQGLAKGSEAYKSLQRQHTDAWALAGGYYADWHCCAVFIANTRIFIYDPQYNSTTNPRRTQGLPRRITTDFADIAMVRHLVEWGDSGSHRIRINRNHMYIYRNNDTLQRRNTGANIQMAAAPGRDCVPLCIQWLMGIAKAWQYDPQEWLECGIDTITRQATQHGAIPVPQSSTTTALDPATAIPAHFDAADWERIRI